MSESFEDLLTELRPDADALQQAARYYLAEHTGDMPVDAMRAELENAGDAAVADGVIARLEGDSAAVETACLTVLAAAWEDPGERDAVRGALQDAKSQMPVVEAAILAVVAAYGMYLLATRGRKRRVIVRRRDPDGSVVEIDDTDYAEAGGVFSAIIGLVS